MKIALCLIISFIWKPEYNAYEMSIQHKDFQKMSECMHWANQESYIGPIPGADLTYRGCFWEYRI